MLDSIFHLTLNLLLYCVFALKRLDFAIYTRRYYGRRYIAIPKSVNH